MDIISYAMGRKKGVEEGTGTVILDTDAYTFTDTNSDGNIVIEEVE